MPNQTKRHKGLLSTGPCGHSPGFRYSEIFSRIRFARSFGRNKTLDSRLDFSRDPRASMLVVVIVVVVVVVVVVVFVAS
jgi:hypothetical protein